MVNPNARRRPERQQTTPGYVFAPHVLMRALSHCICSDSPKEAAGHSRALCAYHALLRATAADDAHGLLPDGAHLEAHH